MSLLPQFRQTLRSLPLAVILTSLIAVTSCDRARAQAQKPPAISPFSKKPIGIIWDTNITQTGAINYFSKIGNEHGIKLPWMINESTREQMERFNPERDVEKASAKGTMYFFRRGLIPSLERVGFRTVKDEKEFRQLMLNRKQMFGGGSDSTLEGDGNRYQLTLRFGPREKDGEKSFSYEQTSYFRCDGDIMFDATFEELYDMDLPATAKLALRGAKSNFDSVAEFNLNEIPKGYKDIAWNMLSVQTGSMLQQRDDEENAFYKMRRTAGDLALEVIKRAIYDLEFGGYTLKLIDKGEPLEFDLKLKPRKGTELESQLKDIGRPSSRFSGVIADSSAFTMASTWKIPDQLTELIEATAGYIRQQGESEFSAGDTEQKLALAEVLSVVERTAKKQDFDAFLKVDVDREGEFVFYGAMQLSEADRLFKHLPVLMDALPEEEFEKIVQSTQGDLQIFTLPFRNNIFEADDSIADLLPTQLNFTVARSALWFSLGKDSSPEVIEKAVANASQPDRANSEQFLFDFNPEKWVIDSSSSGKKPQQAIRQLEQSLDGMFGLGVRTVDEDGNPVDLPKNSKKNTRELAGETLAVDGFGSIRMTFSREGLQLKGRIGDGLARFVIGRYLISISRMMESMQNQQTEAQNELKAVAEEAQSEGN